MTAPGPSSGTSALRIGGFALIGVAALAGVIGLATLAGGGGEGQPGAQSSPAQATSPSTPSPAPAAPPPAAIPPPATGAPTATGPPGGTAAPGVPGAPGAGGVGGVAAVRAPLRVYNNSTITGLAEQAAADFRSAGWPVTQVGNYSSGIIPTSTVYFRPGTDEEAAARELGSEFGLRVEPRFAGLEAASPGLIVIVTRDYQRR